MYRAFVMFLPSSEYRFHGNAMMMRMQRCVLMVSAALSVWYQCYDCKHKWSVKCCFINAATSLTAAGYSWLQSAET